MATPAWIVGSIVGFVAYLLIGMKIGAVSWDHYHSSIRISFNNHLYRTVERKTWAMWLLFPAATASKDFEESTPWRWIGEFEKRETYLKCLAFFWPIKLAMCLTALVIILVWSLISFTAWLFIWPFRIFLDLSTKLFKETGLGEEPRKLAWQRLKTRVTTMLAGRSRRLRIAETPGNRLAAFKQELADLEGRKTKVVAEIQQLEKQQAEEEGSAVYRADRSSGSRWHADTN